MGRSVSDHSFQEKKNEQNQYTMYDKKKLQKKLKKILIEKINKKKILLIEIKNKIQKILFIV